MKAAGGFIAGTTTAGGYGLLGKLNKAAAQTDYGEYAKIVKVYTTVAARGFRATVVLPSKKTNNNPGDFINFYCALAGFECGLSTKAPEPLWGWFVNAPGTYKDTTLVPQYSNGTTKTIALYIGSDEYMRFDVDGVNKFTSGSKYNTVAGGQPNNSARFVVGAAQVVNSTSNPNEYTAPWRIYHEQVFVDNMQYLDSGNVWQSINSRNSTYLVKHTPESITPPSPVNYRATFYLDNSQFYASLKP